MIRSTIINIVKKFFITIPNSLTMPPVAMRSMITSRGLWLWRGMEMVMVMKMAAPDGDVWRWRLELRVSVTSVANLI